MQNIKPILFQMTINVDAPDVAKQYTIFDMNPSFFTLSKVEKREFLEKEESKIKQIITDALSPRFRL
jgi:hypothetical protein